MRIREWGGNGYNTQWSEYARLETSLLNRTDWQCNRIAAPWGPGTLKPDPEQFYRKEFVVKKYVA